MDIIMKINTVNKVKILNLEIDNFSMLEFLENLQSGIVFTPNVDHLIRLQKDPDFYSAYSNSTYRLCDSQIVLYASKFLGTPLKEKVSGSDLLPNFYNHHKYNEQMKIFLLGAAEGVAFQAKNKINLKVGREIIVGAYSPPFGFEKDFQECSKIVEMVNASGATVLAIGVGAPKQEKWICQHKHHLVNIKIFMAVGATIDFEAGNVQRSPRWMSQIGMEWLFRLICEPKRLWKRYLVDDLPFFILILKQKLNLYSAPEPATSTQSQSNADEPIQPVPATSSKLATESKLYQYVTSTTQKINLP